VSKKIENTNRLRYVRALERFLKSIVGYLALSQEIEREKFNKKVANAQKLLLRAPVAPLYKGDLQDLEKLVQRIVLLSESDETIEDIKEEILYSANQLEKTKNARRYKKQKHSKIDLEEW